MAAWELFQRLAQAIFTGEGKGESEWPPATLVQDGVEAVVAAVEPRIRLLPRYQARLAPGVRATLLHLRALGREALQEPLELSPSAWGEHRTVNALFAGPRDIVDLAGRCDELRAFFDGHAGCDTAWLVLAMAMEERTVFAPVLSGERVIHDVRQTSVSFARHRLLAPTATLQETRVEIGWRILLRLAGVAAERIAEIQGRAANLDERRAMLATQLRALQARHSGLDAIAEEGAGREAKMRELEQAIAAARDELQETRANLDSLDDYVEQIDQVLANPAEFVGLSRRDIRINRMGMRIDETVADDPGAADLHLIEIAIGPSVRGIIEIVHFRRDLMPPKVDLLAEAERYL